jgi:hypothetical protein
MSVILFSSKNDVFTTMAQSYENLKFFTRMRVGRTFSQDDDYRFYKALRRLYFANVACWLCQYHDDTPLPPHELTQIETFANFEQCRHCPAGSPGKLVQAFLAAWGSLTYNLSTNDGELYRAVDSYEYINDLAYCYARAYVDSWEEVI